LTTFPKQLQDRLTHGIKQAQTSLKLHTQQIVNLQSQSAATSALVPGDWENITLTNGWANVAGAIPAQARLITTTTVQLIANIQGGTTANGTVIGTLTQGFYNTVHAHTFQAIAVTGAQNVANAVTQGSLTSRQVDQVSVTGVGHIPVNAHTYSVAGSSVTITAGSLGSNDAGDMSFSSQSVTNGTLNNNQTTPINYNNPSITLGTDGTLKISNVHAGVTAISFHESHLPLFTA
jgi:hypothetical protein